MRKVSNYADTKLRKEQLGVLASIIGGLKDIDDVEIFINGFFTESEKAYLGQRLNIMRMLAKHFSYTQIKQKLGVPTSTITSSSKLPEEAGDDFKNLILLYKFVPLEMNQNGSSRPASKPLVKPHYPGAIKT